MEGWGAQKQPKVPLAGKNDKENSGQLSPNEMLLSSLNVSTNMQGKQERG